MFGGYTLSSNAGTDWRTACGTQPRFQTLHPLSTPHQEQDLGRQDQGWGKKLADYVAYVGISGNVGTDWRTACGTQPRFQALQLLSSPHQTQNLSRPEQGWQTLRLTRTPQPTQEWLQECSRNQG
jgi:hypothetical protein